MTSPETPSPSDPPAPSRLRALAIQARRRLWLTDGLVGVIPVGGMAALTVLSRPDAFTAHPGLSGGWLALGLIPAALRRWRPWWAVTLTVLYTVAPVLTPQDIQLTETGMPFLVVVYSVAANQPLRPALAATAVLWIPTLVATGFALSREQDQTRDPTQLAMSPPTVIVINVLVGVGLFIAGRFMFARHTYAQTLARRAEAAETNQRALAVAAVAEERRRVARELHDVVAHHLNVVSVLSSGARRALAHDPTAVDEALATIEAAGRTGLREMRRLLEVLRTDDRTTGDPTDPGQGIDAIASLVEHVRDTGLEVTLTCDPRARDISPALAMTVYRIVQEGLTNTLKYAGPATASVTIAFPEGEGCLSVEVSDTGRGPHHTDPNHRGHGLIGMRERVGIFGGTLRTGPRPGGGFRVMATLPLENPT